MRVASCWQGLVGVKQGRSILLDSYHQSPLKVAKPFSDSNGQLILYLMDASPGLFNGDRQEITCTVQAGAQLYLTNQASCKLHPSTEAEASYQRQHFRVGAGAVLEYFPEPLVPYRGASLVSDTVIEMEADSCVAMGEIVTAGRTGRGECFAYERITSQLAVYLDGRQLVWDSLFLEPKSWQTTNGLLDHYTHIGTLWILSEKVTKHHVSLLQELLLPYHGGELYAGASLLTDGGLVVRVLGTSVWALQKVLVECWQALSVEMIGRKATVVRK